MLKIDAVTRLKVVEVFTFMMYELDLNSVKSVKVNE